MSEIPPEWRIVPADRSSLTWPPVIGKAAVVPASVAGAITPGAMPRLVSAASAPASISSDVALSARMSASSVCERTFAVPSNRPFLNAVTPNVALSAVAAFCVSRARSPLTLVLKPARLTRAPVSRSRCTRCPPTRALSMIRRPTATRGERSVSRFPPAEKRSPPACRIVPAAVAGSMRPPVIGKRTPAEPARARPVGATDTPRPSSAVAAPRESLRVVAPPVRSTSAEAAGARASAATVVAAAVRVRFTSAPC